ncbi:Interleukin-24 [Camelus dromedarius]|uniref:Interleukin-24 n=1 Tax=Camelus dromedarius TaxID=9838 RepID=A0A5N4CIF6_CAMDR|nr:Interleukin-24 [Camelus dromedarius]
MASSLDGTDAPEMPQPRIPGRFLVEQQQQPRIVLVPPLQHMGFPVHAAALPRLSLILLLWSCGPGGQSQELQFGPCRVEGVVLQKLWEAFRAVKDIVQAQDNITSVRLLRKEVLQNVSVLSLPALNHQVLVLFISPHSYERGRVVQKEEYGPDGEAGVLGAGLEAESCYLIHALLKFYLDTVFRNYRRKAAEFRILRSLSTLANNFIVIMSKLQLSQENKMFSTRESARKRFLLFQRAFKQLDREAAVTKAFGEVDILLTWMEKFQQL